MKNLNNLRMNVVQTSENGVVNEETIFNFRQSGNMVEANYSGGQIAQGFLVGKIQGDILQFSYCQLQTDGELDNGISKSEISVKTNGKIRLTEHFEWASREGQSGVNIFEEL
ncbi:n-acetylglutamate synthase [Flagellimonas aquimarina]|uniref:N-acetylglutamate synthase n=2 Tax=Flagellimonas aquimarina TaxID=2201895 RepID=A0A316KZS1_9FLAO|nr:n-acetylglutamate synthase [Allomuricauda koreensis]